MTWMVYACLTVGLASALVAGVFQSFSDFVMRGLVTARASAGIEAMQRINVTVYRSAFLVMFIALAPITLVFAVYALFSLSGATRILLLIGSAAYLAFVFLVTVLGNVPMNQKLADMDATLSETAEYWRAYGRVWTRWNHLRTAGSALTAACYILAAQFMA